MAKFVLQKVLDKKGWTQYALAKALKTTPAQVYAWCQPKCNPTMKTMVRIANELNVKLDDLVEGK